MADDFLENALDAAPPEVQADANAMPLATETPTNAAQRVATGQRSAALYGRMKAADLATRGIPSYSTPDGQTKEITDDSGQALTSMDPKNGIAYDSTGAPVSYKGRDDSGNPVLTDPYQEAPRVTDKQGNIMSAPKGLGWRYEGQDPEVAASYQAAQDEKMNQLTASALAPYEAQAKTAASQAAKAVKASAKQTAAALAQNGVPLTDETGQPAFDLHDVDGPTLKAHIDSTFNKQYASPEANATPWFGGGQYSSDAQALRQDIDNRKAAANAAVDAHLSTLTAAQTAQDAADNLTNQRQALQASKLDYVNGLRAKAGLPPIELPALSQASSQTETQSQLGGPNGGQTQDQNGSQKPSTPESAIPGLSADGSATPAAAANASESAIPGISHEGEALMQGGVSASISQEDHQKLSAALPPSAQAALVPPKVNSDGKVQPEGFWATAGRAFGTKIIPSAATAIGGLAAGALAIESGPGAVAVDIAGGAAAGYGAAKAQQAVMGKDWTAQNEAQMKANAEAHPVAAQIGTMVPFLISLLGGGGGGIVKAGEGVAGRAITAEGKQAVQDAVRTGVMSTVPLAERLAQKAALGARGGAGEGVQYPNATPGSVIDSAAKGAATFGATALFAPAKTLLGAVLGTSVKDSAAMALASQIYDTAIHGKPFDLSKVAHEAGGNLPAFMLQNALLGFLTHGMARPGEPPSLPNGSGEKPINGTDRDVPPEDGGPTAGTGPTRGGGGGGGEPAPEVNTGQKSLTQGSEVDIVASNTKKLGEMGYSSDEIASMGNAEADRRVRQGIAKPADTAPTGAAPEKTAPTQEQSQKLADLGYTDDDVAKMGPNEAQRRIDKEIVKASGAPEPVTTLNGEPVTESGPLSPLGKARLSALGFTDEQISEMPTEKARRLAFPIDKPFKATKFAEPQGSQETPGVAPEAAPLATVEPVKTIDDAAHEAATSPFSPKPAPTPAQIGKNAPVGRFSVGGLPVSIEHPAGTSRKEGWKPLTAHYGYLRTVADSGDGEKMDVLVKTGMPEDYKGPVFVVNRHAEPDGSIDHKVLVGPSSREETAKIHNENYPEGLHVKPADIAEYSSPEAFKAWAQSADQHKEPAPGDTPITKETNEPTQENAEPSSSTPAPGGKAQVEPATVAGDGERGGETPARATADEVATHIQKLRKGALKSRFDLLQTRLERVAPGYAGKPEESSGLKTMVNPRTEKLEIWHDPEAIAHSVGVIEDNWKARGKSPQEARARALDAIKASVQEELIHSSQRVFERGGPQFEATYAKFWRNDVPKVVRDIFTAMRNTKGESDAQKAVEFERMLIQLRESDTITEALFGDPFLESQFERLKPFLQSIQSLAIEDNISRVMTLVAEHGEPEAKAAPAAEEEESAIPGVKKDRGPPDKPAKKAPSSELEKSNIPSVNQAKPAGAKRTFKRKVPEPIGGHDLIESVLSDIGKITHPETARRDALRQEGKTVFNRTTERGGQYDGWMNLPEALRDKAVYEGFPLFAAKPSVAEKKPGAIPGFDSGGNLMAAEKEGLPTLHTSNATIVGPGEIPLSAAKPILSERGYALGGEDAYGKKRIMVFPANDQGYHAWDSTNHPRDARFKKWRFKNGTLNWVQHTPDAADKEDVEHSLSQKGLAVARHKDWASGESLSAAKPLVAHHGTPYKVDRFSSEKIGTGEGAYAFGYGLYFAESHDAAEFYRKNISRRQSVKDGNTYTVHLDVDPDELLDWDKDIGEQTPVVKAALSKHPVGKDFVENQPWQSVQFFYDSLVIDRVFGRGEKAQSEGLAALGIPGAKYFDAGSRDAGGGTRNYVMFDDSKIHIPHENGQPVSMEDAQSGLAAAKPMSWEGVTQAFHDLSEKSGWDSLVNAAQLFMSPDSRLTKEEKERFRKAGDPNAIGDARKTGIFLDGVTAEMDRRKKRWEHALKGARDLVSKLSPALQLELMKRIDEGTPLKAGPIKDAIDAVAMMDAIDAVAKMDAQRVQEAKDWFDAHGQAHWKNYENFLKNVVPHYFKDATQADKVMDQFLRDKKMQGGTGFLKHRADVTMREIIEWAATQGIKLEPKHENVIDAIMDRWTQQERYFGAHEMIEQMEKNGTGHWEKADYMPRAGERMVNNIIGSRVIDGPDGHRIRQHFFADEPSARVVNNYLSRGLRADHKFVENYFIAANVLNALQLGLSAFHAGFVTMEGMVSNFARGLEKILGWDFSGLKDLAMAPFSTISDWKLGRSIEKEMLNPGSMAPNMAAVVNEMVKGGFRQGVDSFYQDNHIKAFMDAIHGTKVFSGILRAPLALIELVAKPLMEHYVPQMKAAAVYKLAEMHLKKNPNMTAMEMRRQLQEDVRSGNNRFGQMTYDNLHLHKTVKDLLMALTRSLGWNWGTFAELGGGFVDWANFAKDAAIYGAKKIAGGGGKKPPGGGEGESPSGDDYEPGGAKFPRVTNKMAYTLALPLLVGLFGAVLSAFFGKKPKELKDYYFVQTGDIDDHGNPVRVVLPSYMKDLFHAFRDPLSTVTNKLHPILSMIAQMLQNKDFYGVEIRHSGDPAMKQILEELKYLGKTSLPFTVTNTRKSTSPTLKVAGYLGVTQAPADAGKTEAQVLADKLNVAQIPNKARTQEDADHSALRNQIIGLERAGQPSGAALLSKSEAAGKMMPKDVVYINKMAGMTRLQASVSHLSVPDAEKVLDAASPAERMEIAPLIAEKKARQARTMYAGQ